MPFGRAISRDCADCHLGNEETEQSAGAKIKGPIWLQGIRRRDLPRRTGVRKVLVGGGYPGMGTGDPDLYKAFCWRFWHLSATEGGHIGVVLPRSALAAKGSTEFRLAMFGDAASVDATMLLNNRKWVFDEVHPQYSIGLVCIAHGVPEEKSIRLRGPFDSRNSFDKGDRSTARCVRSGSGSGLERLPHPCPCCPHEDSIEVFAQLRKDPAAGPERGPGQWRARPDTELARYSTKAADGPCQPYIAPTAIGRFTRASPSTSGILTPAPITPGLTRNPPSTGFRRSAYGRAGVVVTALIGSSYGQICERTLRLWTYLERPQHVAELWTGREWRFGTYIAIRTRLKGPSCACPWCHRKCLFHHQARVRIFFGRAATEKDQAFIARRVVLHSSRLVCAPFCRE